MQPTYLSSLALAADKDTLLSLWPKWVFRKVKAPPEVASSGDETQADETLRNDKSDK